MIGQRIAPRTGVMTLQNIENLDAKPEVHGPFPGMATKLKSTPRADTFRVSWSSRGYDQKSMVEADAVWSAEGFLWFSKEQNLTGVFNNKMVESVILQTATEDK